MGRKNLARLAIAASIVLTSILVVTGAPRRAPIGREDFDRLRQGMSRAEVEAVLHGPPRNDLAHSAMIWMPRPEGRPVSARFEPATPAVEFLVKEDRPPGPRPGRNVSTSDDFFPGAPPDGHQAVWVSGRGLAAVRFDGDGRLRDRYFSTVQEDDPPTFVGWLASRPAEIRRSLGL